MNYVIAGYTAVFVVLGTYSLRVVARARALSRELSRDVRSGRE